MFIYIYIYSRLKITYSSYKFYNLFPHVRSMVHSRIVNVFESWPTLEPEKNFEEVEN